MQKTNLKTALFALKHNLKRIKSKDRYTKLFVKKMNAKASELGMTATRFVHPDGGGTSNKSTVHIEMSLSPLFGQTGRKRFCVRAPSKEPLFCKAPCTPIILQRNTKF